MANGSDDHDGDGRPPRFAADPSALDAAAHLVRHLRGGPEQQQQPQQQQQQQQPQPQPPDDDGLAATPELEARFGFHGADGRFHAGVPEAFFFECIRACEAWRGWGSVDEWAHSVDFCYQHGEEFVRTSRTEHGDVTHQAKHILARRDFALAHDGGGDAPRALRVSVASETPKRADELPETVQPTLVRDKQRKSFAHKAFRYDFTRVFEGANREAIDAARREGRERFEVEVECVGWEAYKERHADDAYIASSLLLKMCDFIDAPSVRVATR